MANRRGAGSSDGPLYKGAAIGLVVSYLAPLNGNLLFHIVVFVIAGLVAFLVLEFMREEKLTQIKQDAEAESKRRQMEFEKQLEEGRKKATEIADARRKIVRNVKARAVQLSGSEAAYETKVRQNSLSILESKLDAVVQSLNDPSKILTFNAKNLFGQAITSDNRHKDNSVIVTWSRSVGSLTDKDRIALIILEFMWLLKSIREENYDAAKGAIVYNNGQCQTQSHHPFFHKFMDMLKRNELISSPQAAFDEILNAYRRGVPGGFPFIEALMKKGSNWFDAGDVANSRIFTNISGPFTLALGSLKDSKGQLYFKGDESLITIAPAGSGKTLCHVLPNLASYCGPVIALDVKGDCYEATHSVRGNLGAVHRFSPLDIENSAHYNPIDFVSDNPLKVWEDAQKLAKLIVVTDTPTHWDNRAMELLTAIIAHVKLNDAEKNMTKVCDWTYASTDQLHDLIFELTESDVNGMRRTGNAMYNTLKNTPKVFESNLESLRGYLGAWQGDNISAVTSRSDWSPIDFMEGKNSPSLFLVIPPSEIKTYAAVLRVLIGQHLDCFFRDHSKPAKHPILVMLDEMPQLGYMEQIPKAQDTGRSYNVRVWMFAQYVGQLQNAYGKEIAGGMIAGAGVRMYMNPSDDNASKLSEILGETEDLITGLKEPLASPTQLTGPEFRSDVIVKAKGETPARLSKEFYGNMNHETLTGALRSWASSNVTLDDRASLSDAVEDEPEVEREEAPSMSLT